MVGSLWLVLSTLTGQTPFYVLTVYHFLKANTGNPWRVLLASFFLYSLSFPF